MPEPITKVQRWLDLVTYLLTRHFPVPVEELMERLPAYARDWKGGEKKDRDSVRRKFERDKDELRAFGIPIETVTYSINHGLEQSVGYRISKKGFYLPYLKLLKEEGLTASAPEDGPQPVLTEELNLFTLQPDGSVEIRGEVASDAAWGLKELADVPGFPLASEARSAYRKFTFDLDPTPSPRRDVYFAVPPETVKSEKYLGVLSDALLRRKKVKFPYHGIERNELTNREVRPFGLLFKNSHWYLVGWDEIRHGKRIFRVDRMESVQVNPSAPSTPDYEMPSEPILQAYRNREAWELGEDEEPIQALVRFRFPASLWADRNGYGKKVGEDEDGGALRQFEIRQPDPFLRWILSLEGDAVIESPVSLREGLRNLAKQVADIYREDSDG